MVGWAVQQDLRPMVPLPVNSNRVEAHHWLRADHFGAVLGASGNMDEVTSSEHNRIFSHADAKAAGENSVNLVSRMSMAGKKRSRRIDIARDLIARLLQLAAHGLLRQGAILFRIPALDFHCLCLAYWGLVVSAGRLTARELAAAVSSLPTESNTPLMNCTDSGEENLRAISSASLITTG